MKIKRYGSMEVYQQLGLLSLLPRARIQPRFVAAKPREYQVDDQGVKHIDTWIAPVAGRMQMITLV